MNLNELRAAYQEADRVFSDLVPSTTEQIASKLIVALEAEAEVKDRTIDRYEVALYEIVELGSDPRMGSVAVECAAVAKTVLRETLADLRARAGEEAAS